MSGNKIEFKSDSKQLILSLKKEMKKELNKNRYEHTIGVAYTASSLAMRYGIDINKALIAGLLHDCAKCIDDETKIEKCAKYGLTITDYEKRNAYLLHSKLGAALAKNKYGIDDEDIYNAIWYHTTGTKEMTMLMKIIFIADYIEPGRKMIDSLTEIRELAFVDIDRCMKKILENTISYLRTIMGDDIEENTLIAYNYYKNF